MSLKTILNKQTDFTGEFPAEYAASGLWRFNESAPDEDTSLVDESGCGRNFTIVNWSGTTANLSKSPKAASSDSTSTILPLKRPICRSPMTAASLPISVSALLWAVG